MRRLAHLGVHFALPGLLLLTAGAAPGRNIECGGQIIEAEARKVIGFDDLTARLKDVRFVVFGERHGVRAQAMASACVLGALAEGERPTTLVMEMLSRDDDATVKAYREDHPESPAGLGVTLKWWARGWPALDNWLPLVDRAFAVRAAMVGGDLPAKDSKPRKLSKTDAAELRAKLGKAQKSAHDSWRAAMLEAHCGALDKDQADNLANHQIRRDLSIADSAVDVTDNGGRALVQVGRGHSRKDRSLAVILSSLAPSSVIMIGAFAEGEPIKPEDWTAYDYVWVTGTAMISDPCAWMQNGQETRQ